MMCAGRAVEGGIKQSSQCWAEVVSGSSLLSSGTSLSPPHLPMYAYSFVMAFFARNPFIRVSPLVGLACSLLLQSDVLYLLSLVFQERIPIPPPDKTKEDVLLFFKLYNPEKEELR
jgi:hypothetical protein